MHDLDALSLTTIPPGTHTTRTHRASHAYHTQGTHTHSGDAYHTQGTHTHSGDACARQTQVMPCELNACGMRNLGHHARHTQVTHARHTYLRSHIPHSVTHASIQLTYHAQATHTPYHTPHSRAHQAQVPAQAQRNSRNVHIEF
jgi:hypothetical protein